MSDRSKAVVASVLGVSALVAGLYFSGWMTLTLLGLDSVPLQWNTWWGYFKALGLPQVAPHAGKIKLGGAIGFGFPSLVWLGLMYLLFKPKAKSLHGDARLATRADLAKAGLLNDSPESIVIGRLGRDLIRLGGQQHVLLTAPTRSGKTVGVAIPVLLTYQGSIVAMDIKGELYALTSGWRQAQGQQVVVFAPYAEDRRTHRFNPFLCLSSDPDLRVNQLQGIAATLYPDDPNKDPFWTNQARTAFFGFASYMFEHWDHSARSARLEPNASDLFPSFERIYRLSAGEGGDLKEFVQGLMQKEFVSSRTKTALSSLAALAEQTFSSVIGSMQEPLQQFLSPVLAAATNACDFTVADLRRRRMTIYVVVPPNKLAESRKILNIFFSLVVSENTKVLPQEDPSIKHQCLLLMDEFTSIEKVDILASSISYTAGFWVRSLPIIQSLSQLDATYGAEVAQTFRTNHAASIVFTPREQRDAEEYSKLLGDTTVRRRQRSTSHGQGGSVSYTELEERRPLMLPQELKALPGDVELIFYEGCPHPIKCQKIRYYEDKFFKDRLLEKVPVPVMPVNEKGGEAMNKLTQVAVAVAGLALASCANPASTTGAAGSIEMSAEQQTGAEEESDERPDFKLNPNPKQAYEVTLTIGADAPGPFAVVRSSASYHAPDCRYTTNRAMGAGSNPDESVPVDFVKVDDRTYRGTFHLDAMLDEDYDGPDGSPPCHWKLMGVGAYLGATGAPGETRFYPDLRLEDVLAEKTVATYINRRIYPRHPDAEDYQSSGQTDRSKYGPGISDSDLFTITLSAKKVSQ